MSPFVLFPRMSRMPFLVRLRVPKHPEFEFAFRLEPIVQLTARLFAASEIDFVCATSDFLVTPPGVSTVCRRRGALRRSHDVQVRVRHTRPHDVCAGTPVSIRKSRGLWIEWPHDHQCGPMAFARFDQLSFHLQPIFHVPSVRAGAFRNLRRAHGVFQSVSSARAVSCQRTTLGPLVRDRRHKSRYRYTLGDYRFLDAVVDD
jgi:hypothetical protein